MGKLFYRLIAVFCALALCLTSAAALSVEDARQLLEENYVDALPDAAYEATTLDELFLAVGDPYTYYMSAPDYDAFTASVESETSVTGIGAGIEYTVDGIRLTSILPDSGAEEAGLKAGDYIIAVDGVSCVPASDTHRSLIVGEAGTYVTITVRHSDGTMQDYRIRRRAVTLRNTTITSENGVTYIDCNSFGSQTAEYFYDGVEQYDDATRFWIVDLRNNPGGLADAAVGALGTFTGPGVKLLYRAGDGNWIYTSFNADAETDKPAVMLVNGNSASASEILTGGIRAQEAGIVLGRRTYGKGSAQIVLDENNYPELFSGDSLKITAYRFYCSDGNTTDRIGVLPTLYIDDAHVSAVAELLTAERPRTGEYLTLTLNGHDFYVNLETARSDRYAPAFAELLSALPPDVSVKRVRNGVTETLTAAQALEAYGDAETSRAFGDVADSAYADAINTLAAYRILGGDGAGRFSPERKLARAELAVLLSQALNVTSNASGLFSDVPDGRWYTGSVNAVASLGLMGGVGGGRFDPDAALTQEQFIAVMGRLARFLNFYVDSYADGLGDEELNAAAFASLASWARAEGNVLTQYDGNMLYDELGAIDPKAPVTREQAAATLYNMLKSLNILSY